MGCSLVSHESNSGRKTRRPARHRARRVVMGTMTTLLPAIAPHASSNPTYRHSIPRSDRPVPWEISGWYARAFAPRPNHSGWNQTTRGRGSRFARSTHYLYTPRILLKASPIGYTRQALVDSPRYQGALPVAPSRRWIPQELVVMQEAAAREQVGAGTLSSTRWNPLADPLFFRIPNARVYTGTPLPRRHIIRRFSQGDATKVRRSLAPRVPVPSPSWGLIPLCLSALSAETTSLVRPT